MTRPRLCQCPGKWQTGYRDDSTQEDPTVPQSVGSPPAPPHFSPSWNALQRHGAVSSASAASPRAFQKLGCNRKTTQGKCRNNSLATGASSKLYTFSKSFRLGPTVFEGIRAGATPACRQPAPCPAATRGPPIHTGLSCFC